MTSWIPWKLAAAERRRFCYPQCRDPWFNECADCWQSGGNPALYPASATTRDSGALPDPVSPVVGALLEQQQGGEAGDGRG